MYYQYFSILEPFNLVLAIKVECGGPEIRLVEEHIQSNCTYWTAVSSSRAENCISPLQTTNEFLAF